MSALSSLAFALDGAFPVPHSPLLFSNLRNLTLRSQSLHPISQLLSHSKLPVIAFFAVSIDGYPSRQDLSSFLSHILVSGAGQTIKSLSSERRDSFPDSEVLIFDTEYLQLCLAFSNLDDFRLEIRSPVDLKGSGWLGSTSSCLVGRLDADAHVHLSRMPALSRLAFAQNATFHSTHHYSSPTCAVWPYVRKAYTRFRSYSPTAGFLSSDLSMSLLAAVFLGRSCPPSCPVF